jgi:hypothetical protein
MRTASLLHPPRIIRADGYGDDDGDGDENDAKFKATVVVVVLLVVLVVAVSSRCSCAGAESGRLQLKVRAVLPPASPYQGAVPRRRTKALLYRLR